MPRITRLRELRGGNVAVDLDGGEWRTLPADAVVRAGLAEGLELDRERLRVLGRERRRSEGIARATRALRYRDLSTERLDERLAKAGIPPAARRKTVASLTMTGLLDDERLAAALAVSLADRGFGDDAIRARLEQQ